MSLYKLRKCSKGTEILRRHMPVDQEAELLWYVYNRLPYIAEFLEFCEGTGVGVVWEELPTTSLLLCSTYLKIKGISSLKVLKFKYTRENTDIVMWGDGSLVVTSEHLVAA